MIFGLFTLFVALTISAVAEFYSIVGLTAIFSAAFWPVVIMGASLGVGKVTAAVWLKMNWHRASLTYKLYLVPAIAFLMVLTSMGIFGFLSKAHSDQSLVSGDSMAKVAIYDEKIKTERENIDANRKALKQLDEAVDQVMGRSTDEKGADKAVAIRRGQQAERGRLLKEIGESQKRITALNEERAPLAAEVRKVDAEVGPVKYIAALVYGDNPDASILEKAVRLVIILIVAVFDPLALVLILAAQQSLRWAKEEPKEEKPDAWVADVGDKPTEEEKAAYEADDGPLTDDQIQQVKDSVEEKKSVFERYPYLTKPFSHFTSTKPMVYKPEIYAGNPADFQEPWPEEKKQELVKVMEELVAEDDVKNDPEVKKFFERGRKVARALDRGDPLPEETRPDTTVVEVEEPAKEPQPEVKQERWIPPVKEIYVPPETMEPPPKEIVQVAEAVDKGKNKFELTADNDTKISNEVRAHFGTEFPSDPEKGEMYLRVDRLPSVLYKYNGTNWIQVDKKLTDTYLYNEEYLKYLIEKIEAKTIDIDDLSDSERGQIEEYLLNAKSNRNAT